MPSLWQLTCRYSSIKSTAAYTKHRASLFLTDRNIDSLLNLREDAFSLFLAEFTLPRLNPTAQSYKCITENLIIRHTHRFCILVPTAPEARHQ